MLFAYQKYQKEKEEEDRQLWSDLLSGTQKALTALFVKHHGHLYNYGVKINSDRELVRECIQKLFENLWRKHRYLSHAVSVKAYLLSSLRRLILEEVGKKKARAIRNREYLDRNSMDVFTVEQLIIKDEITQEKRKTLQMAVNELSPRQKEAIFLRFYHGLSNSEISTVMKINDQCVRNLLSDAIQRIRESTEKRFQIEKEGKNKS